MFSVDRVYMEQVLRKNLESLKSLWGGEVTLSPVDGADNFYTDGLSAGAWFKLTFNLNKSFYGTAYIFNEKKWYITYSNKEIEEVIRNWISGLHI